MQDYKISMMHWKRNLGNIKRYLERSFEKILSQTSPPLLLSLFPIKSAIIETTNFCNLHCPLCPTQSSNREKGIMSFSDFLQIAESLPLSIQNVSLYLSGEPLINKNIFRMVKFLVNRNINCSISTNGTLLGKNIEKLLDSGLSELIIGVDGATEDTYKKYRKGGNFPVLIENIRRLVQEKRKRRLKTPFIKIQFIITKHTEKELDLAVKLAKDLKVDAISFISVSLGTHQTDEKTRKKLAQEYLPHDLSFSRYNIDKEERVINKWKYNYCPHWKIPVILWNGNITVCCFDHNGLEVYGNPLKKNLLEVWKSKEHYQVVKKIIFRKMKICKTCGLCSGDEHINLKFSN
jgi:MoaA/NifB/PqqE/SkfB family radical SAM enzyme